MKLKDDDFSIEEAMSMIWGEHNRQINKWGFQEHDIYKWLCFLMEETGELSESIAEHDFRKGSLESIKSEAVQTATLAIKIAYMVDKLIKVEEKEEK